MKDEKVTIYTDLVKQGIKEELKEYVGKTITKQKRTEMINKVTTYLNKIIKPYAKVDTVKIEGNKITIEGRSWLEIIL